MIDRRGRTYARDAAAGLLTTFAATVPIHAESAPGSDTWTAAIDLRPVRVTSGGRDGWWIEANQYFFGLGQRSLTSGDGWIGFGGRQGQNFLWSRLQELGYLHIAANGTRTWTPIAGAGPATYTRANLTAERTFAHQLGGETFSRKARVLWTQLWTTPNGGSIDLELRLDGRGIKEFIRIDALARDWIRVNRPPATPAARTWFGFLWELDWSDVPRLYRAGVQIGTGEEFDDSAPLEMRDSQDRLLGLFPTGHCFVEGVGKADLIAATYTVDQVVRPVQRRFWTEAGASRFAVGVRCDFLNQMAPGNLVIDPPQVTDTATGTDCQCGHGDGTISNGHGSNILYCYTDGVAGNQEVPTFRFDMTAMTADTVSAASLAFDYGNDNNNASQTIEAGIDAHDVADMGALAGALNGAENWVPTTAQSVLNVVGNPTSGVTQTVDDANFIAVMQELVTTFGDTVQNVGLRVVSINNEGGRWFSVWDDASTEADPTLSVTQAAGGGAGAYPFRGPQDHFRHMLVR